ncbi:Arm DNA-binding domain-containing protein [Pseudorhodoplanes sinuspersici]|uniref:Integrase DNA-binding domain-containing protein n=1 Tax=Pseudorhodoplanes sinuspersici TaxID=1235591 RepID=A0A1W6ZQB8_9HYPH|nr:Arm DNA-binding domain-containing protein [Pseudorhodoplanes sinuspersici]ARP99608.1 hypothetical protein CAK95_11315 [Pseudorhodoplanes sinuspersici]
MDELGDTKIRNAKPADKEYAIGDGQGLSVAVRPNGTKLWLYRYRFGVKRKNMSFGIFPAAKLLDQGQDPAVVREAKRQENEKLKHTFRAVGEEWAMGDHEARKGKQGQGDDQAGTLESWSAQSRNR